MIEQEILQAEAQAIQEVYRLLPGELTKSSEKPLGKLLIANNLSGSIVGKLLNVTSHLKLTEHHGSRGGLTYKRSKDSISISEAIQVADAIHLQPGLANLTILRSTRIKPQKLKPVVIESDKPKTEEPKIEGEFGKYYFFITADKTIGFGRLETIQAVFNEDTIIGYRYEILHKGKSYITEKLYQSVIEASQSIIL